MFVFTSDLVAAMPDDGSISDPRYPEWFSTWLWIAVVLSGVLAFGVFFILHKKFLPYDAGIPMLVSLLFIWCLVILPAKFDQNFYGWFGEDCFNSNVVTDSREPADWAEPKTLRPSQCIEARENISALGIKNAVQSYQKGFLDYRPLTTGEIEFIYGCLLTVWTWGLYGLVLLCYRKFVIR